jgi:AmiR/NasT family two-component response regulator
MSNERVFIIEDEAVVSEFLRTKLESIDYDVVGEAKRGEKAVEYCRDHPVDMLLVDIKLDGELDGIETAKKILQDTDCVIIYITAYSDTELLERAKGTEPAGYLIKPVDEEELVCTMEIALSNQSLKEQRDRALREKEELLQEIRDVVNHNARIMSELLDLQTQEDDVIDLEGRGDEAFESMLDLKERLDTMDVDGGD